MPKIAIRDDDPNALTTTPEEILEAYGQFWGKIPISFSVIPFVHAGVLEVRRLSKEGEIALTEEFIRHFRQLEASLKGKKLLEYHTVKPISDNHDLVSFLRKGIKKKYCHIMMHGFSHKFYLDGAEFACVENPENKLRLGRTLLEELFSEKVDIFTPPRNCISRKSVTALRKQGFRLIIAGFRGISVRNWRGLFNYPVFVNVYKRLLGLDRSALQCRPYNIGGLQVFPSYSFYPMSRVEDVLAHIERAFAICGKACLGTHSYALAEDEAYRGRFHQVITEIFDRYPQVHFVPANDLFGP